MAPIRIDLNYSIFFQNDGDLFGGKIGYIGDILLRQTFSRAVETDLGSLFSSSLFSSNTKSNMPPKYTL